MIRISSTFSSKLVLATSITLVVSIPATIAMRILDIANPWMLFGIDEPYGDPSADFGEYLNAYFNIFSIFTIQYLLNLLLIWPLAFAYSFWTIPSRLIIHEDGLRIKNFGAEISYGFEQVKGLRFKQGNSGENFLKLKIHRQWYTFEIDHGQMRTLNKYIPTYLKGSSNDKI